MSTSGGLVSNILTFVGTVATLGIFFAGGALFFTVYEGDIWTTRTVNSQILCLDWTFFDAFYFWDVPNQTIDFHVNFFIRFENLFRNYVVSEVSGQFHHLHHHRVW